MADFESLYSLCDEEMLILPTEDEVTEKRKRKE